MKRSVRNLCATCEAQRRCFGHKKPLVRHANSSRVIQYVYCRENSRDGVPDECQQEQSPARLYPQLRGRSQGCCKCLAARLANECLSYVLLLRFACMPCLLFLCLVSVLSRGAARACGTAKATTHTFPFAHVLPCLLMIKKESATFGTHSKTKAHALSQAGAHTAHRICSSHHAPWPQHVLRAAACC